KPRVKTSLRSHRLQDSGLTRLAGCDSDVAVWQLSACGRVPRGSRLRMGCTFFRTCSCFAELKGLFSFVSQGPGELIIRWSQVQNPGGPSNVSKKLRRFHVWLAVLRLCLDCRKLLAFAASALAPSSDLQR